MYVCDGRYASHVRGWDIICISVYICVYACLSIYRSIYLPSCLPAYLPICFLAGDVRLKPCWPKCWPTNPRMEDIKIIYSIWLHPASGRFYYAGFWQQYVELTEKGGGKLWHGRILWIMEKYRTLRNTWIYLDICRHHSLVLHISPNWAASPWFLSHCNLASIFPYGGLQKIWITPNHPCSMGFSINKNHPPLMEHPVCYHLGEL